MPGPMLHGGGEKIKSVWGHQARCPKPCCMAGENRLKYTSYAYGGHLSCSPCHAAQLGRTDKNVNYALWDLDAELF
jgi:hypothetical protein